MAQSWWQWLRAWWNIGTLGGFSRLYDTNSKIRARQRTRNEQGYNTTLGSKCVRHNLRPSSVPPKTTPHQAPPPFSLYAEPRSSNEMSAARRACFVISFPLGDTDFPLALLIQNCASRSYRGQAPHFTACGQIKKPRPARRFCHRKMGSTADLGAAAADLERRRHCGSRRQRVYVQATAL